MKVTTNHSSIKQTRRHFCASGSILLPLAQKWGLGAVMLCGTFVALVLSSLSGGCVSALSSITLEIPGDLSLSVSPDSELHSQKSEAIKIKTDAYAGYTFTIRGNDEQGRLMNGGIGLGSISGPLDETTYKGSGNLNTWAYLPSKLNSIINDKYQPGPTTADITIDKTTAANNDTANEYTIALAAKVDGTIPTGQYTGTFVLTATANPVPYEITYELNEGTGDFANPQTGSGAEGSEITLAPAPTKDGYTFMGWCSTKTTDEKCGDSTEPTYEASASYPLTNSPNEFTLWAMWKQDTLPMQNWRGCSSLGVHDTVILKDTRDGNTYMVRKLKDGKCWMAENLRLCPSDKTTTLTKNDSDVSSDFELPASSTRGFSSNTAQNVYVDSKWGGYYTWCAATAGTCTGLNSDGAKATSSICPKGWRLPIGGSGGDFETLANAYGNSSSAQSTTLRETDGPNFLLSGYYYSSSPYNQDNYGRYWSSTAYNSNYAYILDLHSSSINPTNRDLKYVGFSVRCVAMDTMQTVDQWGSSVAQDQTVTAIDERDGKTYTVSRLADGMLWMTQNLAIDGDSTMELGPSTSDVVNTFTLPASASSSFNGAQYDASYIYIDSNANYGGYYSWFAATAGEGKSNMSSGNTAHSICPKGWTLPTRNQIGTLVNTSNNKIAGNFTVLAGYCDEGGCPRSDGSIGSWWSSTANDGSYAYDLYATGSDFGLDGINKNSSWSVRCVERLKTMQTVDEWGDSVQEGQTVTAVDERDGNTYTVRRLDDGKLWMVENLRLGGNSSIQLTPADSDVTSNYNLPASSTSGFSSQSAQNVYVDSTWAGITPCVPLQLVLVLGLIATEQKPQTLFAPKAGIYPLVAAMGISKRSLMLMVALLPQQVPPSEQQTAPTSLFLATSNIARWALKMSKATIGPQRRTIARVPMVFVFMKSVPFQSITPTSLGGSPYAVWRISSVSPYLSKLRSTEFYANPDNISRSTELYRHKFRFYTANLKIGAVKKKLVQK